MAAPFCILFSSILKRFQFLCILTTIIVRVLKITISVGKQCTSLWFSFAFPQWLLMLSIFWCTHSPFVCLFWRKVYSDLLPVFLLLDYLSLLLRCKSTLYMLNTKSLSDICFEKILFHSVSCLFIFLIASFSVQKFLSQICISFSLLFVFLVSYIRKHMSGRSLEREMATHSSILAWEIPWTEEPGRLQSMGSQKGWTWLSN